MGTEGRNNLVINLSVLKNVSTLLHKNSEVLIKKKNHGINPRK